MSDLEGSQQSSKPEKLHYLSIEDAAASTNSVIPVTATSIEQSQRYYKKSAWRNTSSNYMQDNDLL